MTSRTDEIQKLIADIDNLLNGNGKRLSRLLSGQAQEPREVLERIRNFLVSLQEPETLANTDQESAGGQIYHSSLLTKFVEQNQNSAVVDKHSASAEGNNFSFQEFKNELSELIQPLQGEITALLQERTVLMQEIRQLEQKRLQNYSLTQQLAHQEQIITDFLQALMSRLVPTLTLQMGEGGINSGNYSNGTQTSRLELPAAPQPFWESSEHGERLEQLTKDLDQRLLALDGTVNVVFDGLERNINTYHESLSQALARMHNTGLQGEQLIIDLVNNLTQHLNKISLDSLATSKETTQTPPVIQTASTQTVAEMATTTSPVNPLPQTSTDELDQVLLQLGVDAPLTLEDPTTPATLLPDNWELGNDEVDLIYASLFGIDTLTNPTLEVSPDLITPDITADLPQVEIEESLAISSKDPLAEADTAAIMPDVWFDQSDVDLFDFSDSLGLETTIQPESTELASDSVSASLFDFNDAPELETSVAPPESTQPYPETQPQLETPAATVSPSQVNPRELLPEPEIGTGYPSPSVDGDALPEALSYAPPEVFAPTEPNLDDTITSLVDLDFPTPVVETDDLSLGSVTEKPAVEPVTQQQPSTADSYIPASPQENLLSGAVAQIGNPPDISLNEQQWLQLHQDLAKLDDPFSESQTDVVVDKPAPPQPEISPQNQVAVPQADVSPDPSVTPPTTENGNFPPPVEKKITITTATQSQSVVSPINPGNQNPEVATRSPDGVWYLGIDLGTTGISAALLNRVSGVVYPIYWSTEAQPGTNSFQQSFRLPAEVYLPTASIPQGASEKDVAELKNHLYSVQLKPYLQVAIPYKTEQQKWEPILQFNESSAGPLIWVVRSLSKLLLTLKADRYSTTQGLIATAVGLSQRAFHGIVSNIAGVICNCPSTWSEQYRFNVREALLTSKLIQHPQQVYFVEEAIASLLSLLDGANSEEVKISTNKGLTTAKNTEHSLVGNTLIMNIGATATEMALVDIPQNLGELSHDNFMLHNFAYASKGLEQDIICQLLLSPKYRKARWENSEDGQKITSNPWQWQPTVPGLDRMQWDSLGLEQLELPRLGEPDIPARIALQQRLESSLLGQAILDAALALKLILQHQESFTLELADQRWVLQRRDLESQVFVPFARRLNRELNKLLVARGIPTEAINQAILTGGVANLGVVNLWVRQKLPNAKIIQDSYLGENGAPNCSRVASGLALLPLHPQVLEESRQQYTDYFLFTELLRLLPDRSLSFNEVLQLFEARGINTSICQQRLLAFLEGELPPGLIPTTPESSWVTAYSLNNRDYQAIATPLFEKQGNLTYRPNTQQLQTLHRYLDAMKASTQQSLEEPYTVNLVASVGV